MTGPQTLFDKVWAAHEVVCGENRDTLLWVDRHYVHEGSFHAFTQLDERGESVAEPDLTFAMADLPDPPHVRERIRKLEQETASLRGRLDAATPRTRSVLERVHFLRQQSHAEHR